MILKLTWKSLLNRRLSTSLTVISLALSIALFLSVERIRTGLKEGFTKSISQTDLVVGPRGHPLSILLYSVFHIGTPTNNLSYKSFEEISKYPSVAWSIPLSYGDTHKGFVVTATNKSFFEHYKTKLQAALEFSEGNLWKGNEEVILGSEVQKALSYQLGDPIVLAHGGSDEAELLEHSDHPFKVVGVLNPTGTAVDRSLYIHLESMEAIHDEHDEHAADHAHDHKHEHEAEHKDHDGISAFLIGVRTKADLLQIQREISEFKKEPLTAVIPSLAMGELWNMMSYAENALLCISILLVVICVLGILISIYNLLNERRREVSILRALGVSKIQMALLFVSESFLLGVGGIILGLGIFWAFIFSLSPLLESRFGIHMNWDILSPREAIFLGITLLAAVLLGLIPAIRAYRNSLADGLSLRL